MTVFEYTSILGELKMLEYFGGVVNVGKKERLGERVSEQRSGKKKEGCFT